LIFSAFGAEIILQQQKGLAFGAKLFQSYSIVSRFATDFFVKYLMNVLMNFFALRMVCVLIVEFDSLN